MALLGAVGYQPGQTDVAVADGGTGSSTAAAARTALGVALGSDAQAYDTDLAALAALAVAGLVARTGAGTVDARTITGTADQVNVADGDGVSGDPTLSLPQDIDTAAGVQFGKVGAGVTPLYAVHIQQGAGSGADAPTVSYNDLVIDSATTGGMSILTSDASNANIALGNVTDQTSALVQWNGSAVRLEFGSYVEGGELRLRSGNGALAMTIASDQRVSIGTTNGSAMLRVHQAGSAANIPVMLLEQDDISEPFLTLRGSATSANLSRSIVDAADVGTATVAGYAMINVVDDGDVIADQDYFIPLYTLAP